MPDTCNALMRIDDKLDFNKSNCRWSSESSGRKKLKKDMIEVVKRSKIQNPKYIGLVMEGDHLAFIQRQALQKSVVEGRIIQPNELIREALQIAFPAPKQYDMFGSKK